MAINVDELLQPISPDEPAGPSLEYDPDYLAMLRSAEGVPEQQMGGQSGAVIPAVEPDWSAVKKGAVGVLKRSKDLRAATLLDLSLCRTEGLTGLRDGLQLLKGLVDQYWEPLHPKLDPEDDNDPTERMSILRIFATREEGKEEQPMVTALRNTPLADSRLAGRYGLRDIAFATGELAVAEGQAKPDMKVVEAAARDMGVEALTVARDAVDQSVTLVKELEATVDAHVGRGRGIDFKEFTRNLQSALKYLNQFLALHGVGGDAGGDGGPGDVADGGGGGGAAGQGGGGGSPMSGDIRSTADVSRVLEKICAFYARAEPSSPIPLLLRRAQRLVGKDFWQVLQELSPDAVDTVKKISGADPNLVEETS